MLERGVEEELLEYCSHNGIGVTAYSPMKTELSTGKYTREAVAKLPENDWRRGSGDFNDPRLSANLHFIEQFKPIAKRNGVNVAQLVIG